MRGAEFAELKAFVAIVDRASFARAADHLGLSASALSQIIRQLEGRLGVRLLNRTTRSVSPTETGKRLHERVSPMLREMDDAVAQAVGRDVPDRRDASHKYPEHGCQEADRPAAREIPRGVPACCPGRRR